MRSYITEKAGKDSPLITAYNSILQCEEDLISGNTKQPSSAKRPSHKLETAIDNLKKYHSNHPKTNTQATACYQDLLDTLQKGIDISNETGQEYTIREPLQKLFKQYEVTMIEEHKAKKGGADGLYGLFENTSQSLDFIAVPGAGEYRRIARAAGAIDFYKESGAPLGGYNK